MLFLPGLVEWYGEAPILSLVDSVLNNVLQLNFNFLVMLFLPGLVEWYDEAFILWTSSS